MRRRPSLRVTATIGALLAASAIALAPTPAGSAVAHTTTGTGATAGAIGPGQAFVATVNHRTGRQQPAPVRVACAGPVRPNATTHPLAHQPLEVVRAAASNPNAGATGPHGTRITAYLGIPPGAATASHGAAATGSLPTFTRYGVPQPIPTSITVPCSGRGYITFMPWPRDPGQSRAFVVPIEYVNIAV